MSNRGQVKPVPVNRRILTVHSPVPPGVLDDLLSSIETALVRSGATRVWLDTRWSPALVVMAELPDGTAHGNIGLPVCADSDRASMVPPPR